MKIEQMKKIVHTYRVDLQNFQAMSTGQVGGEMEEEMYEEIRNSVNSPGNAIIQMSYLIKFLGKLELALNQSEPDVEKCHRWLGFAQGALWMSGAFGIAKLRAHNRSEL